MLIDKKSMELINDMEGFVTRYYDELEGRAYVDREEVGKSRFYTNMIVIDLDNVLQLTIRLSTDDYRAILHSGIDYALIEALRRELDGIDEINNFEHALSPESLRDEKDLMNEQLLEWVSMDVMKLDQILNSLEESFKVLPYK